MGKIGDDHLANGTGIAGESNALIEDAGRAVFPGDAG
jgi:hypothetical protein